MTHVTIAGGGLAGLSAALRLAERGYRVKLYESKGVLGGNVASRHVGERVWLDVYPHMYLNWYHNFWALLADVTDAEREELFRPMEGVQWLRPGTYPRFRGLKNPYRPRNLLRNLIDGPAPAADLYLFLYASIDLMAERLNPTLRLGDVSVNGFLRARPYMTERTAEFFDDLIVDIWGIPSYLAAADDYQDFLEYSVADPSPPFWLARGSGHDQVLAPLEAKLRTLGVSLAMDDFGTGYSSLGYLLRFRFDKIKIDRSFIHELTHGGDAAAIVSAVVALCHSLGIRSNAEGVEGERELTLLRDHGCHEIQGFHIGRPMPAAQFQNLLSVADL